MYRRKLTKEERAARAARIEADKAMVDAIREAFKMAPLYGADPLNRRSDEERFGGTLYLETRGQGMRTRYLVG